MDDWNLTNAHNLHPTAGLADLPDLSVDAVITDPPYSRKVHEKSRRGLTDYKEKKGPEARAKRNRDLGFKPLTPEEREAMSKEFARITKRWVLVFCDHEGSEPWKQDLEAAGLEYIRTGVWIKEGCTPQMTGDRPAAGHECIVIAHQRSRVTGKPLRKRWNGGGKRAVWSYPIVLDRGNTKQRFHPTQKPLALMRELVRDFTDPEDLVCDPYAGSGTTGVACKMERRWFVGWEENAEWFEIAYRRIAGQAGAEDPNQPELF